MRSSFPHVTGHHSRHVVHGEWQVPHTMQQGSGAWYPRERLRNVEWPVPAGCCLQSRSIRQPCRALRGASRSHHISYSNRTPDGPLCSTAHATPPDGIQPQRSQGELRADRNATGKDSSFNCFRILCHLGEESAKRPPFPHRICQSRASLSPSNAP